jgi:hypothetical protein
MVGERKTRAMAKLMEAAGFKTAIIEADSMSACALAPTIRRSPCSAWTAR